MSEGHGHVKPRADGSKAKCGGPGICFQCNAEKAQIDREFTLSIINSEAVGQAQQNFTGQYSQVVPQTVQSGNKPHKWAKEIHAFADGHIIQRQRVTTRFVGDIRPDPNSLIENPWIDCDNPDFGDLDCIFRIKPEPEYPKSRMEDVDLYNAWQEEININSSITSLMRYLVDSAIRRAIDDGDVILPNKD